MGVFVGTTHSDSFCYLNSVSYGRLALVSAFTSASILSALLIGIYALLSADQFAALNIRKS